MRRKKGYRRKYRRVKRIRKLNRVPRAGFRM